MTKVVSSLHPQSTTGSAKISAAAEMYEAVDAGRWWGVSICPVAWTAVPGSLPASHAERLEQVVVFVRRRLLRLRLGGGLRVGLRDQVIRIRSLVGFEVK